MSKAQATDERVKLDFDAAMALVADGDEVHTFMNPGANMLIGADWERSKIEEQIRKHGAELAGEAATGMKHGLVSFIDPKTPLFIATKESAKAQESP